MNKNTGAPIRERAPAPAPAGVAYTGTQFQPAIVPQGTKAPSPLTPQFLQQAYDLTALSASNGSTDTVAIVDFYGYSAAENDLKVYREKSGLPPCTKASGCFKKVNEKGEEEHYPGPEPSSRETSEQESALDLDAVSALCPNCKILLVEAEDSSSNHVEAAEKTAAELKPNQISDSIGYEPKPGQPLPLETAYVFPGIATTASTGDKGYTERTQYPAAFPKLTAVGGTSTLSRDELRGVYEEAWDHAGSGCATEIAKPAWQHDECTGRSYADISADANPETGLLVYFKGAWLQSGGTSLAAPLTAAYYALLGNAAGVEGGKWASEHEKFLSDVVSGENGFCPENIPYICKAKPGYDGPTGFGAINGDVIAGAPGISYGGKGPASNEGEPVEDYYLKEVGNTTAKVEGGVYPNSEATTAWWEYGTTTSYGQSTQTTNVPIGTALTPVEATLGSLTPGQEYHFRLVAENAKGITYGYDYEFLPGEGPTVSEIAVTSSENPGGFGELTGTLSYTLNPNGRAMHYTEYGPNLAYGQLSSGGEASGVTPQRISESLPHLAPNTRYYYRLTVSNPANNRQVTRQTGSFETGAASSNGSKPPVIPVVTLPITTNTTVLTSPPAVLAPAATKPPGTAAPKAETTAQKLAKALKACHKVKSKSKRATCEKQAKKKYAKPKKKPKKKK